MAHVHSCTKDQRWASYSQPLDASTLQVAVSVDQYLSSNSALSTVPQPDLYISFDMGSAL